MSVTSFILVYVKHVFHSAFIVLRARWQDNFAFYQRRSSRACATKERRVMWDTFCFCFQSLWKFIKKKSVDNTDRNRIVIANLEKFMRYMCGEAAGSYRHSMRGYRFTRKKIVLCINEDIKAVASYGFLFFYKNSERTRLVNVH